MPDKSSTPELSTKFSNFQAPYKILFHANLFYYVRTNFIFPKTLNLDMPHINSDFQRVISP